MTYARRAISLAGVLALCLALTSCKTTPTTPPEQPTTVARLAPGAEGWSEQARLLPASAPIVLTGRPDELLRRGATLFDWLIAQPAMLGPGDEGEARVRSLIGLREAIVMDLGWDILSVKSWSKYGVDLSAPIHVGVYPLSSAGVEFVEDTEATLRARLGQSSGDLATALAHYKGAPPVGLYSDLSRKGRNVEAALGARVVAKVGDEARALDMIDDLASSFEFARANSPASSSIKRLYYADRGHDVPVLSARVEDGSLLVDLFYIPAIAANDPAQRSIEIIKNVEQALATHEEGAPSAPAPLEDPSLALSLSQQNLSTIARFYGYQDALREASANAADERDAALVTALATITRGNKHWDTGAPEISGFTYELHTSGMFEGSVRQLGLEMNIFGTRDAKALEVPTTPVGLTLGTRSVGAAFDPAFFTGDSWKQWLGVSDPSRLLELLDYDESSNFSATLFLLSIPRNAALFVSNFDAMLKAEAPIDFLPLYAQRDKIARVEVAIPGLDLSNVLRNPRMLGLIVLEEDIEPLDRDLVSAALRDTLFFALEEVTPALQPPPEAPVSAAPEEFDAREPLEANQTTAFAAPASHPLSKMVYHYKRDAEQAHIIFGIGVTGAELDAELDALDEPGPQMQQRSFFMRAEPAGLIQLASTYKPASLSFIDPAILAQRVGPLIFAVEPRRANGADVLSYGFELLAPPQLD